MTKNLVLCVKVQLNQSTMAVLSWFAKKIFQKSVQKNPVGQRGGRGGGFIAVDGLLGGNKK